MSAITLKAAVSSTVGSHKLPRPGSGTLLDLGVAGATFAISLAVIAHGGFGPSRSASPELDLLGITLGACTTWPLVLWRRFPLGVFALTAAAGVVLAGLGYGIDLLIGPTAALYLYAASRRRQTPWAWPDTAIVIGLFIAYLVAAAAALRTFPASELLHTGLAWTGAWFAGGWTRLRREQIADLRAQAQRSEREAERERRLAAAEERARIARDLHDSAGHAINVIAVRAGAARLRHREDPERSLRALEAIEEVARQTATEIDQIVGSLRQGAASGLVEAPHGLASLDTLVARHREAGLEVISEASGTQRPLGVAADQAAYRILQEALTNAARHGAGDARLELAFGEGALALTVTNRLGARGSRPSGPGHGLIGMRERATLVGGSLTAEPTNGVFCVRARIPYGGRQP